MRVRHAITALAALIAIAVAGAASADSLWRRGEEMGANRGLFIDHRASTAGAIVYVLVSETASATSTATTTTGRTSDSTNAAGTGLLNFLPFFSWHNAEHYSGSGTSTRKGTLTGAITARLMEEIAPGTFRIEGTREVAVNSDKQTMRLTGIVRADDITSENTIRSDQVADATISYSGLGPIAKKQKPGILTRLTNWLF
jgi:flagellar L-ring protein FlgH